MKKLELDLGMALGLFAVRKQGELADLSTQAQSLGTKLRAAKSKHNRTEALLAENAQYYELAQELYALKGAGEQTLRALQASRMRVHDATAGGTRRLRHLTQFLNATDLVASPDRGTLRPGLVLRQLHVHHLFYARRYTHKTGAAWPAIC